VSDQYLRMRLESLAAGPSTADWAEARERAARAVVRRRKLALGLAAAATMVVAAPALALSSGVIDFSKAEPAPEPVRLLFSELDFGAPPNMTPAPGVDANETRTVLRRQLFGRPHTLWVAPTKDGGFCMFLLGPSGGGGGGCEKRGTPLSPAAVQPGGGGTPLATFGSVAVREATHVDVLHADGSSTRAGLVWVSAPIDAAFFALEVPAEPEVVGWVVRDAKGKELARRTSPVPLGAAVAP
jgi:hypothetical protein